MGQVSSCGLGQAASRARRTKSLWARFKLTRDPSLLDGIIGLEREALGFCPPGHDGRAASCINLAAALWERYIQGHDPRLLGEIMELEREALELHPPGHAGRAKSCAKLAVSLKALREQTGDPRWLADAIELEREALTLRPPGHPDRAALCANLAVSLAIRYDETSDTGLLRETIDLRREALALRPPTHPDSVAAHPPGNVDRAALCTDLASSLWMRYNETGDSSVLIEAIGLGREALALRPPGHAGRARSCANLALLLKTHHEQTGAVGLFSEAMDLERAALALCPPGHADRGALCGNLAASLWTRYNQTGDASLLSEAIGFEHEALASCPPGHPARALACANLAISLKTCYNQTGDAGLLSKAIDLEREALVLRPPGHPDRAGLCSSLAVSLKARFEQTGDPGVLSEGLGLSREALAWSPPGHTDRAVSCANLALFLKTCFIQTGSASLISEAIGLERESLALRPPGHGDRSASCTNLAMSLKTHYEQTGDVALLIEAINLDREAVVLCPPGHGLRAASCINLAMSLATRYYQTGDLSLFHEAMHFSKEAASGNSPPDMWRSLQVQCGLYLSQRTSSDLAIPRALQCLLEWSRSEAHDLKSSMVMICLQLTDFWSFRIAWTDTVLDLLVSVYSNTIDKLPLMAAFVLDTSSRLVALRYFSKLGSQACIVALRAERLPSAIELLDHAHGVIWAQALHQRDPQSPGVPLALATELESLLRAIAVPLAPELPSDRHITPRDFRHEQNSRIQAILGEIRSMPGLDRFMRGSTFEMLRETALDHPVVLLVAVDDESYAVILSGSSRGELIMMKLEVTSGRMVQLRGYARRAGHQTRAPNEADWRDAWSEPDIYHGSSDDSERLMRPNDPAHSLNSVLSELWNLIVKPVLTRLGLKRAKLDQRPRLHWCPTGHFASLPVHAAGIYAGPNRECSADYIVSSYAPTLTSLLRAQRSRPSTHVRDAKLVLMSSSHTSSGRFVALPDVKKEISLVASIASSVDNCPTILSPAEATNEEISNALQSASVVHIACHGLQNTFDPLESAFHLSDDRKLSVSDLMKLDLKHAQLAFLSACETAKGDREQPDQAIHLAATMLFVGFKSVIGTMWGMRDSDGPTIAGSFYTKLFESDAIDTEAIPRALDDAVRMLREGGAAPERWATFMHVGA